MRVLMILFVVIAIVCGGGGCRKSSKQVKRGAEELFGAFKKANRDYKAAHQCVCFGLGSVMCPSCSGAAFKPTVQMTPYGPMSTLVPCGFCNGTGRIVCPVCNGIGHRN